MFRMENGVTLVALVITIIVLLILAGVTISMVLGDDGIMTQASEARTAQNKATVSDQAGVAYATVRAEQIARDAGVSTKTDAVAIRKDASTTAGSEAAAFVECVAKEMEASKAFDDVYYLAATNQIVVTIDGTKGVEYYQVSFEYAANSIYPTLKANIDTDTAESTAIATSVKDLTAISTTTY